VRGEPVAGAHVAGFVSEGGVPRREDASSAQTTEDGRFRLRLRPAPGHVVIAAARGRAPIAVRADLDPRSETDLGAFTLAAGRAVSGRVLDLDGAGVADMVVRAYGPDAESSLEVGPLDVGWKDGRPFLEVALTRTGADGAYSLEGLGDGEHNVSVRPLMASPGLGASLQRLVTAPARDVDFRLAACRIELRVTREGAPAAATDFVLDDDDGGLHSRTDAEGRLTIQAIPGRRHELSVHADGYERQHFEFVTPAAGEVHVQRVLLLPAERAVKIRLDLTGPDGERLERAAVELWPAGSERSPMRRDAESRGGRLVLTELEPGPYRVRIRPGTVGSGRADRYQEIVADAEVPVSGAVTLTRTAEPGGRLRILVREADGSPAGARCVVRDAEGVEVRVRFVWRGEEYGRSSTAHVIEGGPNDVVPALAPGRYALEFTSDERTVRRTAEVRVGEVTEVDVRLWRR
jgi:hypothetical protein